MQKLACLRDNAARSDKVEVVAECDNSLLATPVLYPIGRVNLKA